LKYLAGNYNGYKIIRTYVLELYLKFQINLFEINLGSTEVLEVDHYLVHFILGDKPILIYVSLTVIHLKYMLY